MEDMAGKPLVSIICGYYNREQYVSQSMDSLISQSYENIEIITFDDCSQDDTYRELKKYEEADSRVRIIRHNNNRGFVNGLVDAIEGSRGKYIAIHGSGDVSHTQRIERQVQVLEERRDVAVAGCYRYNETSNGDINLYRPRVHRNQKTALLWDSGISHGEAMYRRCDYEHAGGYRCAFVYAQDRDLWMRLSRFGRIYIVPEVLYTKKYIPTSVSRNVSTRVEQRIMSAFARYCYMKDCEGDVASVGKIGELEVAALSNDTFMIEDIIHSAWLIDRTYDVAKDEGVAGVNPLANPSAHIQLYFKAPAIFRPVAYWLVRCVNLLRKTVMMLHMNRSPRYIYDEIMCGSLMNLLRGASGLVRAGQLKKLFLSSHSSGDSAAQ